MLPAASSTLPNMSGGRALTTGLEPSMGQAVVRMNTVPAGGELITIAPVALYDESGNMMASSASAGTAIPRPPTAPKNEASSGILGGSGAGGIGGGGAAGTSMAIIAGAAAGGALLLACCIMWALMRQRKKREKKRREARQRKQALVADKKVDKLKKQVRHSTACYAMLCCAMLCYATLRYAMLCQVSRLQRKQLANKAVMRDRLRGAFRRSSIQTRQSARGPGVAEGAAIDSEIVNQIPSLHELIRNLEAQLKEADESLRSFKAASHSIA